MDAFVLLLDIVSPHGPPFSEIVESTSDGIDGPWIVAGQGGMVDDWWQSAPRVEVLLCTVLAGWANF